MTKNEPPPPLVLPKDIPDDYQAQIEAAIAAGKLKKCPGFQSGELKHYDDRLLHMNKAQRLAESKRMTWRLNQARAARRAEENKSRPKAAPKPKPKPKVVRPKREGPPEKYREAFELVRNGMSRKEVCKKFGFKDKSFASNIGRYARDLIGVGVDQLYQFGKKGPNESNQRYIELVRSGMDYRVVCEQYGLNLSTFTKTLGRHAPELLKKNDEETLKRNKEILRRYQAGERSIDIGKDYDMTQSGVMYIVNRFNVQKEWIRGPIPDGRGKRAYELRETGMEWSNIVKEIDGFSNRGAAQDSARRHAKRHNLPYPVPLHNVEGNPTRMPDGRGQRAYEAKRDGRSWPDIAKELGFNGSSSARDSAWRHSQRYKLEWPIQRPIGPMVKITGTVRRPEELAKEAYEARKSGLMWNEVAEKVGFIHSGFARDKARRYAAKHKLPWPLEVSK